MTYNVSSGTLKPLLHHIIYSGIHSKQYGLITGACFSLRIYE